MYVTLFYKGPPGNKYITNADLLIWKKKSVMFTVATMYDYNQLNAKQPIAAHFVQRHV